MEGYTSPNHGLWKDIEIFATIYTPEGRLTIVENLSSISFFSIKLARFFSIKVPTEWAVCKLLGPFNDEMWNFENFSKLS